jgi:WD40 repeat protein
MNDIKRDLEEIRERCERLKAALRWKGPSLDEKSPSSRAEEALSYEEDRGSEPQGQEEGLQHQVSAAQRLQQGVSSDIGDSQGTPGHPLLIDITATDAIQRRDSSSTLKSIISPYSSLVLTQTTPNDGVPEGLQEAVDSNPLPTSLKPEPLGPVQLIKKATKLEDVTISTTGLTIALIERSDFQVLSIARNCEFKSRKDFPLVCQGEPDTTLARVRNQVTVSTYHRAALSDNVLCIACRDGPYIDVHNARTAQRLHTIEPPKKCDNLLLSPNGEVLAVAMDSGEVVCYPIGHESRFDMMPIKLPNFDAGRKVTCMTFSPNSVNLSVCSDDAVIRTYSLNLEICFAAEVSRHACKLSPPLTDVSLLVP